ncbi:MAG: hypothetical protein V3U44_01865 [Alphaproteobacteria bacterium]
MSDLMTLFAVLAGLAAVLVNIALWSPRNVKIKIGALATMALFLPVAYMSLSEMLSRPKPIGIEWSRRQLAEATVLSSHMEEGKAIYLWLGIEDSTEPRAYVLPWNEQMARQLHGARRTAEQMGSSVQMRLPFENSRDRRDQIFYAQPQPPAPAKQQPVQNPLNYQHSQSNNESSAN